MTTDNEQVYLLVGDTLEVYDQHGKKLYAHIVTELGNKSLGEYIKVPYISVTVPAPETKSATIQQFMPGVTLTKPSIRVPVWGQEFVVQSVKLEKGQICVDVTPPVIKDQFGNVLPATSWNNDTITVKTVPGSQYPDPNKRDNLAQTQRQLDNASAELEKVRKDNSIWRENYRLEHERANKLQDDTAKVKRELTEENIRLTVALEAAHKELQAVQQDRANLRNKLDDIKKLMAP